MLEIMFYVVYMPSDHNQAVLLKNLVLPRFFLKSFIHKSMALSELDYSSAKWPERQLGYTPHDDQEGSL